MNKKVIFCIVVLFTFIVLMPDAFARTDNVFPELDSNKANEVIYGKLLELLYNVIGVVMILGGFGLVGLAVGAVFGRVNWKWAAYLAFGLFLCAICFSVLHYFTGDASMSHARMMYDTVDNTTIVITPSD